MVWQVLGRTVPGCPSDLLSSFALCSLSTWPPNCNSDLPSPSAPWEGAICIYLDLNAYVHLTSFRMILSVK